MWCVKMEKEAFIDLYDKDSNKTGKITDMELSHVAEYAELFVSVPSPKKQTKNLGKKPNEKTDK